MQYNQWLLKSYDLAENTTFLNFSNLLISSHKQPVRYKRASRCRQFQYTVFPKIVILDENIYILRVVIHETTRGNASSGGSNFRVNVTSAVHIQVCPVKDFFNGTYLVCCSLDRSLPVQQCTISISQQFCQFNAFKMFPSHTKLIWNYTYMSLFNDTESVYPPCKNVHNLSIVSGYWKRNEKTLNRSFNQYVIRDSSAPGQHCIFPMMSEKTIKQCFTEKFNDDLTMMGDSHIRYAFYYLIQLTTGPSLSRALHRNINVNMHHFQWKPLCKSVTIGLKNYLDERLKDRRLGSGNFSDLLILGIGMWDLKYKSSKVSRTLFQVSWKTTILQC